MTWLARPRNGNIRGLFLRYSRPLVPGRRAATSAEKGLALTQGSSMPIAESPFLLLSNERDDHVSAANGFAAVSARVRKVLANLRSQQPKVDDGPIHCALLSDLEDGSLRGIIGVPARGCSYARTEWGGCAICGHSSSTLWKSNISDDSIISDVRSSLEKLSPARPAVLCLYTSGSFFDDTDLPSRVRLALLDQIAHLPWVTQIVVESLPQFITPTALSEARMHLGTIALSIGMGLDSADQFVRSLCFQRHIKDEVYVYATGLCHARGVRTTAYVVHGPPFLTAEEAVADTSCSIHSALTVLGFDAVSIEPVALQAGTLQHLLRTAGHYECPTFWSLVSASHQYVRLCGTADAASSDLRVGGQVFTPLPIATLRSCTKCLRRSAGDLFPLQAKIFRGAPLSSRHSTACGSPGLTRSVPYHPNRLLMRIESLLGDCLDVRT
jgi:radical SAM enzyme (TIGR01210 family)